MEDKELRQAFEETTTNNVKAGIEYSKATRKLVREQEKKIISLQGIIRQYKEEQEMLKKQINNLQSKVYKGGTQ